MPRFADLQQHAQQARAQHARTGDELAAARTRLRRTEERLARLERTAADDEEARLRERLAEERASAEAALADRAEAHTRAVADLRAAVEELAPHTDPREGIGELDDALPILLLPVRVETRFKSVADVDGAARDQLWVRVFPDSCHIDTFEATLSDDELTNARRYWVEHWAAGGIEQEERGAWRGLVAAHGVGRATWITQQHAPTNPDAAPTKPRREDVLLVVVTHIPLDAPERDALAAYWRALWRADGDKAEQETARAALDAAVGAGRAAELIDAYEPENLQRDPPAPLARTDVNVDVAFLLLPAPDAVEAKQHAWSRAPTAPMLPDRFVFLGYRGDEPPVVAVGAPIVTPLVVGMDPAASGDDQLHQDDGELAVPEPMAWMVDFDRAVEVGMGMRVPLEPDAASGGFDRVLVVGLRLSADADTSQAELEELLEHHRFGASGFSLLPQGTPTNNTEDNSSQPDPNEDVDGSFNDRAAGPLFAPELDWFDKRDGQWLAELLGIDPAVLMHVTHSGGRDQADARAMNAALWPATLGYWMETLMDPVFDRDDVARTREFFTHYVSGRGPVPAMRIGDQPYGVQLATAFSRMAWLRPGRDDVLAPSRHVPGDDYLLRLYGLLRRVDADWAAMADDVAHTGKAGDAHQTLLDIVGLHSGSVEFSQRYAESLEALFNKLNLAGLGPLLAALFVGGIVQSGTDLLARLGYTGEEPPDLLRKLFLGRHNLLSGPLVDDRPLSETEPIRAYTDDGRNYIRWLIDAAGTSLDALYAQRELVDGPPSALLYLLARHSLQLGYHDTSLRLRETAGLLDADAVRAAKREPTFLHVAEQAQVSESRYQSLLTPEPAVTGSDTMLVGDYIGAALPTVGAAWQLREQLRALERLADASTARLERALVEHVDCCSYRLDAWLLGLVRYQLGRMRGIAPGGGPVIERARRAAPRRGLHTGAYAWLEDVRPEPRALDAVQLPEDLAEVFDPADAPPLQRDAANQGWIHAPSLDHAVAAAVLRNGFLSDAGPDNPSTLAINLTSERVRIALGLLEGIRSGQRLGALLGYQLERGLHDRHGLVEIDKFIYPLRKAFPLAGDRMRSTRTDEDVAIEAVEARNVVDGLRIVEHVAGGGPAAYPFGKDLPDATDDEAAAIDAEVQRLLDSHDAVADLALAEGVYQAVQGNYDRVASTYDAFSKGDFPPEPQVVRTPSTGLGVAHRVALHLQPGLDPAVSPLPGTPVTPRAFVEPALNRWVAGVLPAPGDVGCVAAFRDAVTGDPVEAEVTMDDLDVQPIDLLRLLRDDGDQAMTELDDRVVRAVVAVHGPRPDAPIEVRYMDTVAAPFSAFEVMPLARAVRRMVDAARPLVPTDAALTGEATQAADVDVSLDPARVLGVRDDLAALRADVEDRRAALQALLDDLEANMGDLLNDVDAHADAVVALLARAAGFALPQAGWAFVAEFRRRVFAGLRARAGDLVGRWNERLAAFDAVLADEAALPSDATEQRFAILGDAEPLVSTGRLSPLPHDPADYRAHLVAQGAIFAGARDNFAALAATTHTSVSTLLDDAQAAVTTPPIASLDDAGFALDPEVAEVIGFARDAVGTLGVVQTEADARLTSAQARVVEHDAAGEPRARVRALVAAAEALLGPDVVVVPEFGLAADGAAEVGNALAASDDLLAHARGPADVELPVDTWLYGAARTRAQLHLWEQTVMFAGALRRGEPDLVPLQLPHRPGDPWVALDIPADYALDGERLCYTAHLPAGFDPSNRLCGLLLDEWSEVVPTADTTTGVAFHYDRPNAEAPQSFLLVTPSDFRGAWRWDDLVDALHETLDLAKRRAVEPARIDASPYAPFLPATVMAVTVAQLSISANLALNNNVQAHVREG